MSCLFLFEIKSSRIGFVCDDLVLRRNIREELATVLLQIVSKFIVIMISNSEMT